MSYFEADIVEHDFTYDDDSWSATCNCGLCDHYESYGIKCHKITHKVFLCLCKKCYEPHIADYYNKMAEKKINPCSIVNIDNDSVKHNTCNRCVKEIDKDNKIVVFYYEEKYICDDCAEGKKTDFVYHIVSRISEPLEFRCSSCSKKIDLKITNNIISCEDDGQKAKDTRGKNSDKFSYLYTPSAKKLYAEPPKKSIYETYMRDILSQDPKAKPNAKPKRKKKVAVYDDLGFCTYVYK